jgi:hypothetical protein
LIIGEPPDAEVLIYDFRVSTEKTPQRLGIARLRRSALYIKKHAPVADGALADRRRE